MRKAKMTAEEMIRACEEYCNYYSQKLEAALQEPRDEKNDILVRACADKHNVLLYKEKRVENILNILDRLRQENLVTPEDYDEILVNAAKNYDILK